MKKILILFVFLFVLSGCSSSKTIVSEKKLTGYWQQISSNVGGEIKTLDKVSSNYLEITDNKLYIYKEGNQKGYYSEITERYYVIEGNTVYYDYYELKGDNWKSKISDFGGKYEVLFEKDDLIIKKKYDTGNYEGYEINTYKKLNDDFKLLPNK